ncbi:MAG: KpsF/GutQ family sugar-phosphate isomerase [Chlamydiales bacterium]
MILDELFERQNRSLAYFFEHIDKKIAETFLERLYQCEGIIFFSGVGKSGIIAKKAAVTMTSIGTRALYLSPTNALHGDIGMVTKKDMFVLFSKSGESDELLHLIPYLRNREVHVTGIICKSQSRLGEICDSTIILPLDRELDPHNLIPTTSTSVQMIFGDIMAVALMIKKEFHLDQYRMNHPAGRIGRRLLLKVQDLMLTGDNLPIAQPEQQLVDLLVELSNKQCGCLLIVNQEEKLLGIFTDGDLRRSLQKHGSTALERPIKDLMTHSPRCIEPDLLAAKAVEIMEANQKRPITVLPVIQTNQRLVGLIKLHDILQSGI